MASIDKTAVVTTVMVWAAEAGRGCGGKQDELLHVSDAHEYGAAAIFGVRSLEKK